MGLLLLVGASPAREGIRSVHSPPVALRLQAHTHFVLALCFSPDGRLLATGTVDGCVRLWDARDGALLTTVMGLGGDVNGIAFSPGGDQLVAALGRARRVVRHEMRAE